MFLVTNGVIHFLFNFHGTGKWGSIIALRCAGSAGRVILSASFASFFFFVVFFLFLELSLSRDMPWG